MQTLPDHIIARLSKSDFIKVQNNVLTFNLDFTNKVSKIDKQGLESGGQVFRSLIAFLGRLAIQYPQATFKAVIENIRKGRLPKVGMRPQHLASVDVVKTVLETCKRNVVFFEDFREDSETLTIEFGTSRNPEFVKSCTGEMQFNVGKINMKTKQPGEEAASLILQTWLMLTWGLFENEDVTFHAVFGGGLDMGFSPPSDFVKNVLGHQLQFDVEIVKGIRRTGTLNVIMDGNATKMDLCQPISSKYLLDQLIVFLAFQAQAQDQVHVEFTCELTNHARSQIYLWEALLGVAFTIENGICKCSRV
jgi:RNA 3'-terminal phosphate cyclase